MSIKLVSHNLCPYVQRAAISLAEKAVKFERAWIDLGKKPDWFLKRSPLGKVPVLIVTRADREAVIFESAVILEYLEETLPHPLHPEDPLRRAEHRAWMEFGSAILNGIARFYNAGTSEQLDDEAAKLQSMFARLEDQLGDGSWFDGSRFSLVDTVFGPVFRYFDTFEQIADFGFFAENAKGNELAQEPWLADRPSPAPWIVATRTG